VIRSEADAATVVVCTLGVVDEAEPDVAMATVPVRGAVTLSLTNDATTGTAPQTVDLLCSTDGPYRLDADFANITTTHVATLTSQAYPPPVQQP
jgi:hypothetical protein